MGLASPAKTGGAAPRQTPLAPSLQYYRGVDAAEAPAARPRYHVLAVVVAILGGMLGIGGAFLQELTHGGLLVAFVGAPVIEEMLKPAGVYILLIRWPQALRGQLYTATLCALAGLSFGVIEAFVYVTLYVPDHPDWYAVYRFSLPLMMHSLGSFIVGLGINRGIIDWANGTAPLPRSTRNSYITAILLHAVFNITATALQVAGYLDF